MRPRAALVSSVRFGKWREAKRSFPLRLLLAYAALALGVANGVAAQPTLSTPAATGGFPATSAASASPTSQSKPPSPPLAITSAELDAQTAVLIARFEDLKTTLKETKPGWFQTTIVPLLSVIVGGLIVWVGNYWTQNARLTHETGAQETRIAAERDLAHEKAVLEAARALRDWRTKQLEQLYGPLRALLGHSKGVYDQMCRQLAEREGKSKYQFGEAKNSTSEQSFEINIGGCWKDFRLLDQLPHVYQKGLGVDGLIDVIFDIGSQLVDTIKNHAGLALPEQEDLAKTFSEYLAHYAVLKELRESVSKGRPIQPYTVGYYPRTMNKLVDEGFAKVISDIARWDNDISKLAVDVLRDIRKDNS